MARHKDGNWNLPDGTRNANGTSSAEWNTVFAALLMDLRDELKRMNASLHSSRKTSGKRKRHVS